MKTRLEKPFGSHMQENTRVSLFTRFLFPRSVGQGSSHRRRSTWDSAPTTFPSPGIKEHLPTKTTARWRRPGPWGAAALIGYGSAGRAGPSKTAVLIGCRTGWAGRPLWLAAARRRDGLAAVSARFENGDGGRGCAEWGGRRRQQQLRQ